MQKILGILVMIMIALVVVHVNRANADDNAHNAAPAQQASAEVAASAVSSGNAAMPRSYLPGILEADATELGLELEPNQGQAMAARRSCQCTNRCPFSPGRAGTFYNGKFLYCGCL